MRDLNNSYIGMYTDFRNFLAFPPCFTKLFPIQDG